MRRSLLVAAVLLGAAALVSAQDDTKGSFPKHFTGRLSCVTPIDRIKCTRDIRSGFVSGVQYGNEGVSGFYQVCASPNIPDANPAGGLAGGALGQVTYDLSVLGANTKALGSIQYANTVAGPPGNLWYKQDDLTDYVYPAGAPVTQVIVLEAKNPFGQGFGKVPAIIFVYIDEANEPQTAICGNPIYANYYLGNSEVAPPTPVKLQASYSSPLVQPKYEDQDNGKSVFLGALGAFQAKCSPSGRGYLGGDPNVYNRFAIEDLKQVCFLPFNVENNPFNCSTINPDNSTGCAPAGLPAANQTSAFTCDDNAEFCTKPCAYNKKTAKTGVSASCEFNGYGYVTGKYGLIEVDENGTPYEWTYGNEGYSGKTYGSKQAYAEKDESKQQAATLQRVKFEGSVGELLQGQMKAGQEEAAEEAKP